MAIKEMHNIKAPGEDGIPAELYKHGGEELEAELYKLYKLMWEKEEKPKDWEIAVIVAILKKGDKLECENYRGISLLVTAYKIFSRIIYKRLMISQIYLNPQK